MSDAIGATVKDRLGYLGGSDAGIIAFGSMFGTTLFQLYQIKRGEAPSPDLSDVERVQVGSRIEGLIADLYCERTGNKVRRVNKPYFHKEKTWLGGHVDRIVENTDRLLECKNVDGFMAKDWADGVPDKYIPQIQHYLGVTGRMACDVAALIGGNRLVVHTVDRDDEFIEALFALETEFWQRIQDGNPPDPTSLDEAAQRWNAPKEGDVSGTIEHEDLCNRLAEIVQEAKALEKMADDLELQIKAIIGDAGQALTVGGKTIATWKTQTRDGLDSKALEAAHPGLQGSFRKATTFRKFALKA